MLKTIFQIDYIFFVLIMYIIIYLYYDKYLDSNGFWEKIFLILSCAIFVLILIKHYWTCVHENDESKVEHMDEIKLARLRNHSHIDLNNSAIILLRSLLKHPILPRDLSFEKDL